MEEIKRISLDGNTYLLRDDSKLPQPQEPAVGQLLQIGAVENGQVSSLAGVTLEEVKEEFTPILNECRYLEQSTSDFARDAESCAQNAQQYAQEAKTAAEEILEDGIPYIGDNGNWWIGDQDTGAPSRGAAPQRGVDYWTEADQAQMVQDVLAALPDADEVSY